MQHRGLTSIVEVPGWLTIPQMRTYYAKAHVAVVPTRSDFREGMAMAAIEAVVVGRPVVTCAVVPALEVVRPACIEAQVEDVGSYVDAIERLMLDEELYVAKRTACGGEASEFFDRRLGMDTVIQRALEHLLHARGVDFADPGDATGAVRPDLEAWLRRAAG